MGGVADCVPRRQQVSVHAMKQAYALEKEMSHTAVGTCAHA